MSAAEKPFCKSMIPWLEGLCGKGCFAPLTGQDWQALRAFVHLVDLFAHGDMHGRSHAIDAMVATIAAMQPTTRHLAKRVIPHVMDWSDEQRIWGAIEHRLGHEDGGGL